MAQLVLGTRDWNDLDFDKKAKAEKQDKPKNNFMKFSKTGTNVIRLISSPVEYLVHSGWKPDFEDTDPARVQQYGYNVKCSAVGKGARCPLCEDKDLETGKAKNQSGRKWYFAVIDRSDNTVKIMDVKRSIVQSIKNFTLDPDFGNPIKYDLKVTVNVKADPQHYYGVVPGIPKPLSAEDLVLKETFDMNILQKLAEVPTYEQACEQVQKLRNWTSVNFQSKGDKAETPVTAAVQTPVASTVTAAPVMASQSEEVFTFAPVN